MNSMKNLVSFVDGFVGKILVIQQRSVHTRLSEVLANNVTLVKSSNQQNRQDKPIVILYGWLLAKNKHLNRYSDVYLDRGFDILQVKVSPRQVLWPLSVTSTVDRVIDFITNQPKKPILVHGLSVGGFVHTEVMYKLFKSEKDIHAQTIKLIKGQIFDSLVDIVGIEDGISTAMFHDNEILRKLTRSVVKNYLNLTKTTVGAIYERDAEFFYTNPLKIPSLMLHSTKDHIGCPGPIEKAIKTWRKNGVLVDVKCWTDTMHVSHFRSHPDEYVKMIDNFLAKIDLHVAPNLLDTAEDLVTSPKSSFSTPPRISLPTSLTQRPTPSPQPTPDTTPLVTSNSPLIKEDMVNSVRKEKSRIAIKNI